MWSFFSLIHSTVKLKNNGWAFIVLIKLCVIYYVNIYYVDIVNKCILVLGLIVILFINIFIHKCCWNTQKLKQSEISYSHGLFYFIPIIIIIIIIYLFFIFLLLFFFIINIFFFFLNSPVSKCSTETWRASGRSP